MSKRQKLSHVQFEDLPDEVILKICSFMDIREILRCAQVSKRIQAISKDESLWLKLNFYEGYVPYPFLEKAVENGCRYLSLADANLNAVPDMPTLLLRNGKKIPKTTQIRWNLKYLTCYDFDYNGIAVHRGLLKNCHSLQKLSMKNSILSYEDVEHIIQNSETLKVLYLSNNFRYGGLNHVSVTKMIQKLFKKCYELSELNFCNIFSWKDSEILCAIVNNLTPEILKVDLSYDNLKDSHVMALVKRCSKITELKLGWTSITNNSLDSIVKHLDSSLEKLDVSCTKIDSTALLRLGTVRTLKVLNCLNGGESDEIENLRKKLSGISINKEYVIIASPNAMSFPDSNMRLPNLVLSHEDGMWEIKAKQQKLFTENE
mgnify:CR=1 FL=1